MLGIRDSCLSRYPISNTQVCPRPSLSWRLVSYACRTRDIPESHDSALGSLSIMKSCPASLKTSPYIDMHALSSIPPQRLLAFRVLLCLAFTRLSRTVFALEFITSWRREGKYADFLSISAKRNPDIVPSCKQDSCLCRPMRWRGSPHTAQRASFALSCQRIWEWMPKPSTM